ncbi:MAG: hypothetical protein KJ731_16625 [Alphaproteobacteria bacterium]|jgi:hypothetical protein|nr:hypothetical protein [Alphaproteobacteria bacterium]MBU1278855.1 hypothetical protein [Alphaproteobacteria bacterium]MBU1572653.1 hypothetical protein [Alphaproteobacteria bacterium]MBU1830074.1 hypothetical protein [Alphaproteobacteria bacterium]MBU2077503.1 hypothetical protein [Alphaproteobacteria bacterium]
MPFFILEVDHASYARLDERPFGKWQKLNGVNRMPEIIQGIACIDGIKQIQTAA